MKRIIALAIIGIFFFFETAFGYTFSIDSFSVTKNEIPNPIFLDEFTDGNPPPDAPNWINDTPATYYVYGTVGPETGGKLTLDSSHGTAPSAFNNYTGHWVILGSQIRPEYPDSGLREDDTFSVTGVFDLTAPDVNGEGYGIRLSDRIISSDPTVPTNYGNNTLGLGVYRSSSGELGVLYYNTDFTTETITHIEWMTIDPAYEQIALQLSKDDADDNSITASFAYINGGGAYEPKTTFSNTAEIFDGEDYTRAWFYSHTPVPEPTTMFLLGTGLIGLAGTRRRMKS